MLPSKKTFLAFSKNCHYASKGVELNLEKIALGKMGDEKKNDENNRDGHFLDMTGNYFGILTQILVEGLLQR